MSGRDFLTKYFSFFFYFAEEHGNNSICIRNRTERIRKTSNAVVAPPPPPFPFSVAAAADAATVAVADKRKAPQN